jgi:phosphatidylserine/phosphatidylglycerophosphate/cardiolipin synthase-like enzyme
VADDHSLTLAIRRAVTELPANQLHKLAAALTACDAPTALGRHTIVNTVPTAIFRHHAAALCAAWAGEMAALEGESIALAVHTAADAVTDIRGEQQVSVVWTGPASYEVPIRATSAVLTDVIAEAHHELIVVSFAAYKVAEVVHALRAAADRGVTVRLVLESVAESKGRLTHDAKLAFNTLDDDVQFYVWPAELRQTPAGGHAAMHAKCAVADGSVAFVTSANLTGAALTENMELGLVVRGGDAPRRIAAHFKALISSGDLRSVG